MFSCSCSVGVDPADLVVATAEALKQVYQAGLEEEASQATGGCIKSSKSTSCIRVFISVVLGPLAMSGAAILMV